MSHTEGVLQVPETNQILDSAIVVNSAGEKVHREIMVEGSPTIFEALREIELISKAARSIQYDAAGVAITDSVANALKAKLVTPDGGELANDTVNALRVITTDPTDPNAQAAVSVVRGVYAANVLALDDGEDPASYVNTYLLNGGSNDMGIDGTTPVSFTYTPPSGKDLILGRVMIYYSAASAFSEEKFANQTALANGVEMNLGGVTIETWKDNIDVITAMFDLNNVGKTFTKEDKSLAGRWSFYKVSGNTHGMDIINGQTVEIKIQDNLSNLTYFRAKIQGLLMDAV